MQGPNFSFFVFSFWLYKLLSWLLPPVSVKKYSPNKTTNSVATWVSPSCAPARTRSLEGRCLRNRRRSWTLLRVYGNLVFGERSRDCLLLRRRRLPTLSNDYAAMTPSWPIHRVHHRRCWVSVSISSVYLLVLFFASSSICIFRCSSKFI
jgi:hypothetical protein